MAPAVWNVPIEKSARHVIDEVVIAPARSKARVPAEACDGLGESANLGYHKVFIIVHRDRIRDSPAPKIKIFGFAFTADKYLLLL